MEECISNRDVLGLCGLSRMEATVGRYIEEPVGRSELAVRVHDITLDIPYEPQQPFPSMLFCDLRADIGYRTGPSGNATSS